MSIFAPALGALWKQLESYGIDPEPVFRKADVSPETIFDPGARIPIDRYLELDRLAIECSGDPQFGLKGAEHFQPSHLGALGFAWLASSSLRTAFERMHRFSRVIQEQLEVSLSEDEQYFCVQIDARIERYSNKVMEDGQIAGTLKFCRVIAGNDLDPAQVRFRQEKPADTGDYYALFRCPVAFGCEHTQILFRLDDVDKRLTGSNTELAKLNEHIVVRYLAHSARQDIVNQVKAAIIDGLANDTVTEQSVADSLHMTPRNLHRKLQREGTAFKQLLTDVRKDLAQQYIQDRSKTLTEISFLLGFSEVSSFSRAYKNWTGIPPSEARQDVA